MNPMLEAVIEIDRLKDKYKFSAEQVLVLQFLKSVELSGQTYETMLKYFIEKAKEEKDDRQTP